MDRPINTLLLCSNKSRKLRNNLWLALHQTTLDLYLASNFSGQDNIVQLFVDLLAYPLPWTATLSLLQLPAPWEVVILISASIENTPWEILKWTVQISSIFSTKNFPNGQPFVAPDRVYPYCWPRRLLCHRWLPIAIWTSRKSLRGWRRLTEATLWQGWIRRGIYNVVHIDIHIHFWLYIHI